MTPMTNSPMKNPFSIVKTSSNKYISINAVPTVPAAANTAYTVPVGNDSQALDKIKKSKTIIGKSINQCHHVLATLNP